MRNEFLAFSKPSISEEEIAAVADVLRSGWITTGPKTAQFEKDFCTYCNTKGAVALTSATAGMHLLLAALKIGPGDEVITPSMTWASTVNLIVLAGAKPVFVDIDKGNLMTSAELIKPLINSRTKLIIPVHFAGATVDMEPIRKLAAEHNIALVEDAAHAVGAEYKNQKIGMHGNSIFSFHPIKNITSGEGGMFCSDDADLLQSIRRLKFHGLGVDAHDRQQQGRTTQAEVMEPGYKYNMTDISAVLGLGQLSRLDGFIKKRTLLANHYHNRLADVEEILPLSVPPWTTLHAWHLFIVRINTAKSAINRDQFMEELKRKNIGTGLHFRAVHEQHFYKKTFNTSPESLPETEWNSTRICSLPLFPGMTLDDVNYVVASIKEVLA